MPLETKDLDRIKQTVARMAEQYAPPSQIDDYIAKSGVTIDDIRKHTITPPPETGTTMSYLEDFGQMAVKAGANMPDVLQSTMASMAEQSTRDRIQGIKDNAFAVQLARFMTGATKEDDARLIESMQQTADLQGEAARMANRRVQQNQPQLQNDTPAMRFAGDVTRGLVEMAPPLALSIGMKSPAPAAAWFASRGQAEGYRELLDAGYTQEEARLAGNVFAAAESIGFIPIGQAIKAGSPFLKKVARIGVSEGITEAITSAIQEGVRAGTVDPEMSLQDYLSRVGYSGLVGLASGGIVGGVTNLAGVGEKDAVVETDMPPRRSDEEDDTPQIGREERLALPSPDSFRDAINMESPAEFYERDQYATEADAAIRSYMDKFAGQGRLPDYSGTIQQPDQTTEKRFGDSVEEIMLRGATPAFPAPQERLGLPAPALDPNTIELPDMSERAQSVAFMQAEALGARYQTLQAQADFYRRQGFMEAAERMESDAQEARQQGIAAFELADQIRRRGSEPIDLPERSVEQDFEPTPTESAIKAPPPAPTTTSQQVDAEIEQRQEQEQEREEIADAVVETDMPPRRSDEKDAVVEAIQEDVVETPAPRKTRKSKIKKMVEENNLDPALEQETGTPTLNLPDPTTVTPQKLNRLSKQVERAFIDDNNSDTPMTDEEYAALEDYAQRLEQEIETRGKPAIKQQLQQDKEYSVTEAMTPAASRDVGGIVNKVNNIAKRMNPDVEVKFADSLFGEGEALVQSGAESTARQPVAGRYTKARKLVEVSLDMSRFDPEDTAYHELFHSVQDVLTPAERDSLDNAFPARGNMSQREAQAIAFARWAKDFNAEGIAPAVKRIFSKISRFFRDVGKSLRDSGYTRPEDIFMDAERGALAQRQSRTDVPSRRVPDTEFSVTQRSYAIPRDSVWQKSKKAVKRYTKRNFQKEGYLNKKAFARKIQADGVKGAQEMDVAAFIHDMQVEARKAYGKKNYKDVTKTQRSAMSDYLKGDKNAKVPKALKRHLDTMRAHLDRLSGEMQKVISERIDIQISRLSPAAQLQAEAFIESNGEQGSIPDWLIPSFELLQTIESNKGTYLNRSYQAFDDPKWKETALSDPDIMNEAVAYLREQNPDLSDDRIIGDIRAILQDAKDAGDITSLISSGKLGSKDVTLLKKRKDIPAPIRKLLGEYNDPQLLYAKSATKMYSYIANHYMLTRILKDGEGVFLFKQPRGEFDTKVAGKQSDVMSPLNGMYATEDFVQGMKDAVDTFRGDTAYEMFIRFNSSVKYGKTVLAPTTQFRNFMSAAYFTIANGHFDWTHMNKAGQATWADLVSNDQQWRDYLRGMVRLGVLHDNPRAQELKEAIRDVIDEKAFDPQKGALRTALDVSTKLYRSGDDFWKIIGFENEKALLMKHRGLSEADASREAAKRIRDTYPTYSMVPRGIRWLRRFPLMGTFVSFPWEIGRTTLNQYKYIKQELQEGSKALAMRKIMGMSIAHGSATAASVLSMLMFGIDDDDDEAIRALGPPWQKNAHLLYMGYDKDGLPIYMDLSHLTPYSYLQKPISAMLNGQNYTIADTTRDIASEILDPFVGADIAATAIYEFYGNRKATGAPVYNPEDSDVQKAEDIIGHFIKALGPGVVNNIERTYRAAVGDVSRSGKQYNLADEGLAWVGFRRTTLPVQSAIRYSASDFTRRKRDAGALLTYKAGSAGNVSDSELTSAFDNMVEARREVYVDMIRQIQAARKLGMTDRELRGALSAANVAKKDINPLLRGEIPRWRESNQFLNDATKRAINDAATPERKKEIRGIMQERRRLIRELNRDLPRMERKAKSVFETGDASLLEGEKYAMDELSQYAKDNEFYALARMLESEPNVDYYNIYTGALNELT